MRTAWRMPTGCPTLLSVPVFSVPHCSVPPFSYSPTLMLPAIAQVVPEIIPPEDCKCITFLPTVNLEVKAFSVHEPKNPQVKLIMTQVTGDCCEPGFSVRLTGKFPCVPFDMEVTKSISLKGDISQPTGTWKFSHNNTCLIKIDQELQIPCVPFDLKGSYHVSFKGNIAQATGTLKVSHTNTCLIKIDQEFQIPCVPFSMVGTGALSIRTDIVNPTGTIRFSHANTCLIKIDQELQIPCMPLAVSGGNVAIAAGAAAGYLTAYRRPNTCAYKFSLGLQIPNAVVYGYDGYIAMLCSVFFNGAVWQMWRQRVLYSQGVAVSAFRQEAAVKVFSINLVDCT